ncbi:hypothetical protein pclt_cds_425 [Pandoravirus celtis]|uniref:Uncharacterized protein n=1 Tax=Pandoravirus celtis TaxID=2568002 RepID=A0A4D6EGR9_9VIRU|nr:hypothetical protein pclt_cds_425 [Pandoravirus celtis]
MGSDANRGHAGTVGRRRRHRRAAAAPHARGPNMVGTMAIMALLAVVIIMVVIYLVRRLTNAERAIKRTMAEVRHQVTPDDLHTAFGQWVEANPGAVTTACAPYINRSVAVAASAMRVHAPAPPAPHHPGLRGPEAAPPGQQPLAQPHGPAPAAPPHFAPRQPPPLYPPHGQPEGSVHAPRPPTGTAAQQHQPSAQLRPQPQQQPGPTAPPVGTPEQWSNGHALDRQRPHPEAPPRQPAPSAAPAPQPVMPPQAGTPYVPPPSSSSTIVPQQQQQRQQQGQPPVLRAVPPRMRCDGNVCVIIEDQVDDADDDADDTFNGHPASVGDNEDHRDHLPLDSGGGKSPPSGGNDHPLSDEHHESLSDGSDAEDHGNQDEEDDHQYDTEDVDKQHAPMLQVSNTHLDRYVQDTLDAISHASNEEDEDDEDDKEEEEDDDDNEIDKSKRDDGGDPTPQDHGPALDRMRAAYADDPWSMPDDARFFVSHGDESEGDHEDESDHDDGDDSIEANDHDQERDQHDSRGWYDHETPSLFIVLGAPANGLCVPLDHHLGRARITPLDEDEDDAEDRGDDFLDGDSDSDDEPERFPRSIIVGHISDEPAWSLPTDADTGDIDPHRRKRRTSARLPTLNQATPQPRKTLRLLPSMTTATAIWMTWPRTRPSAPSERMPCNKRTLREKRSRKRRTRTTPPPSEPRWTAQTSTRTA